MADMEKSKLIRPLSPTFAYLRTAGRNPVEEAWSGGCAAAGLNPHVSSECQPCSQWLSSAATGPGADTHGGLEDRKEAQLLLSSPCKKKANKDKNITGQQR